MSDLSERKNDHIELALRGDVGFRRTTLLEQVELIHCSLPEVDWASIDVSASLFGRKLRMPVVIASMTGGNERAAKINQELAEVAEQSRVALGLGSQRAMVKNGRIDEEVLRSYSVRSVAPSVPILANIGVVQAGKMEKSLLDEMVGRVDANALIIHLNPAQEMIQADGDRDFRGCLDTIARVRAESSVPVLVKETGNGISREVATRLRVAGIDHVDVSGAGGTTWVGVETRRAQGPEQKRGELFWDWGIPTAASLLEVRPLGFRTVIATGGIKTGLDVARAIALGAHFAGMARPVLQVLDAGGVKAAVETLLRIQEELQVAMLLTGSNTLGALRQAPYLIGPELARWAQRHHGS